jgi:hypothetical protein
MMVITNSGVRGALPCLGCQLHAWLVRRGLKGADPNFEVCAGGVCELPSRAPAEPMHATTGV